MRQIIFWVVLLILLYFLYWINSAHGPQNDLARLQENYAEEVEQICREMQLPAPYFKALIILESSARKPAPSRFEPHVFARLLEVQKEAAPAMAVLPQRSCASSLRTNSEPWPLPGGLCK
ncbi:MAG: hypothetical protein HC913_01655 [Microscillaceae bacterium]|nr:hypothetical protein [Microscillaceae bacterium]